ncbi:MAG: hypothetical protein JWM28_973 [Chitinophagaceae bacterium]|nr:hypothetical protein [Chitinophagaceae bacterium]
MIKVYVDWGVMSQIKQGYHPELLKLLKRKNQLYVIYSTSHISDILVSDTGEDDQNTRINNDLAFISELTDNWCVHNSEKDIVIQQRDPHELFADRANERDEYGDEGPLAYALKLLEPGSAAHNALQSYLSSPLPDTIASGYVDPHSAAGMEQHYPGLAENPTMGNLMKTSWIQNKKLEQSDAYKGLREMVQKGMGINKDKMFAKVQPFAEIDRQYASIKELTGFDIYNILRNDNSPSWFQDISHNYLLLDMHGYQQDKVRFDAKNKDTMRNTMDDGFHAAFASTCEFYVTNDTRSANKAREVYQKLNVNTKIYSPAEFVDYGNNSLVFDDPRKHLNLWYQILKSPKYIESIIEDATWRTYFTEFYFFDYFNKIFVVYAPENTVPLILLSKEKPTNYRFTTKKDIAAIIDKLNIAFEAKGENFIDTSQLSEETKCNWTYQGNTFRLQLLNGYLQLYMDPSEKTSTAEPQSDDPRMR